MENTTKNNTGITAAKTSAALLSTVKAIIIAPKTIKGDRKRSLSVRLTPF